MVTHKRPLSLEIIVSVAVSSLGQPPGRQGRDFLVDFIPINQRKKEVTVLGNSKTNFRSNGACYFVTNCAISVSPCCLFLFCLCSLNLCSHSHAVSASSFTALCEAQAAFFHQFGLGTSLCLRTKHSHHLCSHCCSSSRTSMS